MKSYPTYKIILLMAVFIFLQGCATSGTVVQQPPTETSTAVARSSIIQKISFVEEPNYTKILIEGSEPMALPFYKLLPDPLRIAIDIPNIDLKQIREPIRVDNGTIADVIATQYDGKGRIEIILTQMANYNISKEGRILTIDVEKAKKVAAVKEEKKEENPVTTPETPQAEIKKEEAPVSSPPPVPSAPKVTQKATEVLDFLIEDRKDTFVLNIVSDGAVENYNAFKIDSPARLVLDLWGVNTRYPKKLIKVQSPLIQRIRIGQHPDKLRLVLDSSKSQVPPYQVNRIGDKVIVSVGNVPESSEPQIILPDKGALALVPLKSARPGKPGVVTRIDFTQMDQKSRIVVATTTDPQFEARMISKDILAVDLKNASVSKQLRRTLDTSEFDSMVSQINIQNVKTGKMNDVRILIKLREEVAYETTVEGKTLFIDIERPKRPEAKKEEPAPEVKKVEVKKEEGGPPAGGQKAKTESPIPEVRVPPKTEGEKKVVEEASQEKTYTGRKVSFDFKDADIKNILRLIAEVSNLNIIVGDDVTGKVTMRLVDVPWDQALDVTLQSRGLGMIRVGNVIRIAPTDVLKKEIQSDLEAKRTKEKLEDLVMELIPVNYASAKEITSQAKSIMSERGDIKVDERTNTLIVKDISKNVAAVKSLVKSLDTRTPQVLIEARIVEANLTFQQELGVSWGLQVTAGKTTTQGGLPSSKMVDLPALAQGGTGTALGTAGIFEFLLNNAGSIKLLDIAISAHENKGNVKVISSPKIATLDNKEASIEQGLRIPYLKLTTEGTVTTDFVDANLKLTVTPHVTNDGTIKLNVKAKKDAPDQTITVQGVPSIDKKEAITEVLVSDNGVVVIGGIYTIQKTDGVEGIPLFSKIPLLGWLFKREAKQDQRKDLLIFISPKIIKDEV